ncbi:MAG: PQQ-dependent sugar dehydrogenase, partial [Chloroflexaceae bacterium]|nr:PQQ-dependent sugar dehydrogenase [Chloroflexaceae bacterium]
QQADFYIDYTDTNGDTVIARYFVAADNPNIAEPASEQVILRIEQPFANHNGGQLAFGPEDGYLYIGMGDGGGGGDPQQNAQNRQSLLGKILRINVEGNTGGQPYTIPGTNPFARDATARPEVWALGLRNPWRFAFDQVTGDLYIGDVGQDFMEEINVQPASSTGGENYGWRVVEGDRCFVEEDCDTSGFTAPTITYDHAGGRCSVTGGVVYRGREFPVMYGTYLYADYCSGDIWGLRQRDGAWQNQLLQDSTLVVSTFGYGEDGNIYIGDYNTGQIYRITATQ